MKMTSMPQPVAPFNGVGGGAAALVSIIEFLTGWRIRIQGNPCGDGVHRDRRFCSFTGSILTFPIAAEAITTSSNRHSGRAIHHVTCLVSERWLPESRW